jgi:hypothetical protein
MASQPPSQGPVRVKVYGLISLTRRTYLILQAIGLGVVVPGVLALWWLCPRPAPVQGAFWPNAFVRLLDLVPWMCLLIVVAESVETVLVLRRFARKEAERNAPQAETTSPL